MGALEDMVAHFREMRKDLLDDIAEFESGRHKHSEKRGSEWVDITQDLIKEYKEAAAKLGRLIADYEKKHAQK
jgi:hypothetical protein